MYFVRGKTSTVFFGKDFLLKLPEHGHSLSTTEVTYILPTFLFDVTLYLKTNRTYPMFLICVSLKMLQNIA
jgi:hypothetical protein